MIFPIDRALYKEGHLAILKGNLAEDGAVAKITGLKNPVITGPARVFDDEQSAMDAILGDRIRAGDILVLRYLGPKGGPACRKCSRRRRRSSARASGESVGFITDGRFSGGTWGWWSATSRPRRSSAARSRSCKRVTRSRSTRIGCCCN